MSPTQIARTIAGQHGLPELSTSTVKGWLAASDRARIPTPDELTDSLLSLLRDEIDAIRRTPRGKRDLAKLETIGRMLRQTETGKRPRKAGTDLRSIGAPDPDSDSRPFDASSEAA